MASDNSYLGSISLFAGNFSPRGWAFCDGQLLAISQNDALFSILGTTYGGDGRTTFALPDLRGRALIGPRHGPGLSSYKLGQRGGVEEVTLNLTQMPTHSHTGTVKIPGADPVSRGTDSASPKDAFPAEGGVYGTVANVEMGQANLQTNNTGGNLSHENRAPYLAVNYIICLVGVYPSRS